MTGVPQPARSATRSLRRRPAMPAPRSPDPLRDAIRLVARISASASRGEPEARFTPLDGNFEDPDIRELANGVNGLLDVIDAYLRESSAAIDSASRGVFYRRLLECGLNGAFAQAARTIDSGREALREKTESLDRASEQRRELASELDTTVLRVCDQLTQAATSMGGAASGVVSFAGEAVTDAERATGTVEELRSSSHEIRRAVDLITKVAAQTRLLALNATIEAARAGDAGRGFAVVASEVKTLADEAATSSEAIVERVGAVQEAAAEAITALEGITRRIREMDGMVAEIARAIDGSATGAAAATDGADGADGGTGENLVTLTRELGSAVSGFVRHVGGE